MMKVPTRVYQAITDANYEVGRNGVIRIDYDSDGKDICEVVKDDNTIIRLFGVDEIHFKIVKVSRR